MLSRFTRLIPLTLCAVSLLSCPHVRAAPESEFNFIAVGDTAYSEASYTTFNRLIDRINRAQPSFSIHVGDTKGHQPCDITSLNRVADFFNRFDHPLFYTPGDNEWTDCMPLRSTAQWVRPAVAADTWKLSALNDLRQRFFSKAISLGKNPLPLTRQSDVSPHKHMVENAYWRHQNVLFATFHVVGSMDGHKTRLPAIIQEANERQRANLDWLKHIQGITKIQPIDAVVLIMHAELFSENRDKNKHAITHNAIRGGHKGPYFPIVKALVDFAGQYHKPILLIHGDMHRYVIDKPFTVNGHPDNITRLQVFGEPFINGVKVSVIQNQKTQETRFDITPLK